MRKLAIGLARRGKLLSAIDLAAEAYHVAVGIGAHDQIRRLERLGKLVDSARSWWQ